MCPFAVAALLLGVFLGSKSILLHSQFTYSQSLTRSFILPPYENIQKDYLFICYSSVHFQSSTHSQPPEYNQFSFLFPNAEIQSISSRRRPPANSDSSFFRPDIHVRHLLHSLISAGSRKNSSQHHSPLTANVLVILELL
ncbi:UNVERIFIED_CONTAM: hypothetical protein FKN15_038353 [Acipenser sinensis]